MEFKHKTINTLKKLSSDEQFNYFFAKLDEPEGDKGEYLLDKFAELLVVECNLDWEQLDKVRFFLRLGTKACEAVD